MVKSMMAHANPPISFWGDALLTTTYILNSVPSKSIPTAPYELWFDKKPSLDHLHHRVRLAMCIAQPINIENLVREPQLVHSTSWSSCCAAMVTCLSPISQSTLSCLAIFCLFVMSLFAPFDVYLGYNIIVVCLFVCLFLLCTWSFHINESCNIANLTLHEFSVYCNS